ncbi:protein containing AAA domain [Lentimicrobium saccharophilum]|uniref:Protein containing AAA domain n=1 Tax=Lentimicrobium saccharophilum TaxID=1678841 RepID=A0A0S7C6J0_9BACT|nr:AAA family ATPase [Lentimicrobium saccharophilum]GAP44841.1 protein containing AAA domain [Lentimicrobium saccharophilum]
MENQITSKQDLAIKEIIVEKLFGYFDYRLTNTNTESIENQLLILYGDNGSGKTTILKLIFYLLSSKDKSGHKSKIAQTKFKKFSVILNCGIEIGALRTDGDLGSFNYYIKKKTKILFEVYLKASQDLSIKLDEDAPENVKFKLMLSYLRSLNLLIFYLSDERKALDSLTSVELDEDQISSDVEYYIANEREIQRRRKGIR